LPFMIDFASTPGVNVQHHRTKPYASIALAAVARPV
jgi:hypothetical protein